ncbi:hypothetical protein IWX49DRAFT_261630 [Phyllosticta citricarpa]|uniref:Uncharacterized protein n=1 Tax=Phyllosticta paracitricarpa TaxID=2016321 RepID=A0ABR1N1F9_9PEZI
MAPLELANGINGSSKPSLMKAVRFHGKGDLRLENIPEPHVGPSQVKLKPAWVGICGTGIRSPASSPKPRLFQTQFFTIPHFVRMTSTRFIFCLPSNRNTKISSQPSKANYSSLISRLGQNSG